MNNFNISNTGISIELTLNYNNEQGGWNCDDNFTSLGDSLQFYSTWLDIDKPIEFSDLYTVKPKSVNELTEALDDYDEWEFDNLDDAVAEFDARFSFPADMEDYEQTLDSAGIVYTKKFEEVISRGNSQGDYQKVIIPLALREGYGLKDDINLSETCKGDIDDLLWNAPLSCRIIVNGEDYLSEDFDGQYISFDKTTFINEVMDAYEDSGINMTILKQELVDLVPDEPEYT